MHILQVLKGLLLGELGRGEEPPLMTVLSDSHPCLGVDPIELERLWQRLPAGLLCSTKAERSLRGEREKSILATCPVQRRRREW
jgi:hypothetical protein